MIMKVENIGFDDRYDCHRTGRYCLMQKDPGSDRYWALISSDDRPSLMQMAVDGVNTYVVDLWTMEIIL